MGARKMAATTKQASYLKALMIEAGHAHPQGYLRASAKHLPNGPTMRERSGSVEQWMGRLTVRQASECIDALKKCR